MEFVIIYGNFRTGIQDIHGPFETEFIARNWAINHDRATGVNGDTPFTVHPISITHLMS